MHSGPTVLGDVEFCGLNEQHTVSDVAVALMSVAGASFSPSWHKAEAEPHLAVHGPSLGRTPHRVAVPSLPPLSASCPSRLTSHGSKRWPKERARILLLGFIRCLRCLIHEFGWDPAAETQSRRTGESRNTLQCFGAPTGVGLWVREGVLEGV